MNRCVRTVWNVELQTRKYLGLPFKLEKNTTLNERFDIQVDAVPFPSEMPELNVYSLGIGGHAMTMSTYGIGYSDPVQFKSTAASPYKPMPFVLRELTNDLSPAERDAYCLRKIEMHDGVNYFAYYGKRIDKTNIEPIKQYIVKREDGTEEVTSYTPDATNLSPVPPDILNTGVNILNAEYIRVASIITIPFNSFDAEEYRNVSNILFSTPKLAIISEIVLSSSIDRVIETDGMGGSKINFKEVIACQPSLFSNYFNSAYEQELGFDITLDIGATEPLFVYAPVV